MSRRPLHLAVAGILVAAGVQRLIGQGPPQQPTFRVEVELVELDAFVTDAEGNPVTTLTADDFEVLEDGTPQAIASFALVNIPIERAERPLFSTRPIEPDVQTNDRPEGRVYLIALDEVRPDLALRARKFLRRFIEQHLGANDVAAVVLTGRARSVDAQDFTSNPRLLITRSRSSATAFRPLRARWGPPRGRTRCETPRRACARSPNSWQASADGGRPCCS